MLYERGCSKLHIYPKDTIFVVIRSVISSNNVVAYVVVRCIPAQLARRRSCVNMFKTAKIKTFNKYVSYIASKYSLKGLYPHFLGFEFSLLLFCPLQIGDVYKRFDEFLSTHFPDITNVP